MAFQDVMHTSNPIYEYAFSWTIDNFSKLSSKTVRGPTFSPIPGYSEKFYFELRFEYSMNKTLYSYLRNVSAEAISLVMYGNVTLRNTNEILKETTVNLTSVTQTTYLFSYYQYDNVQRIYKSLSGLGLEDSKLTMQGTLKFSDYGLTSSIYSLSIQQPSKNCEDLTKDLKTIYETGLGSDVTFSVGEEKFRAHKAILLGRSPVFAKMFEHDMLERSTCNVKIEDIDSHIFNCFLMFLYTGVVEDEKYETVKSLYSVAGKYQVKSLQKLCCVLLVNHLSVESVCSILVLADLHADEELKKTVKIFIRQNFFDIAGTTDWVQLVTNRPNLADEVLNYMKSLHK